MKRLEDFKSEQVDLNNIYGGLKAWKTAFMSCGNQCADMYDDVTGKCYDCLGNEIHC